MSNQKFDKRYPITRYLSVDPTSEHNTAKGYNPGNFIRNIVTGELFYTETNGVHIRLAESDESKVQSYPLDRLKQTFYRNLEADNNARISASKKKKMKVTLSGDAGSFDITIGEVTGQVSLSDTIANAAAQFVTDHAADFLPLVVTADATGIIFEAGTTGAEFSILVHNETDDFTGAVSTIVANDVLQTPITLIDISAAGVYTYANMPFIGDLIKNPTNWLTFSVESDWPDYTNTAVKILTTEYIGTVEIDEVEYTNCCRITTKEAINAAAVGHGMCVLTWRAYGINARYTPVVAPDYVIGSWKQQQTGMQFMYRHSDGRYIGFVNGTNTNLTPPNNRIGKFVWTNDPLNGTWQGLFSPLTNNTDDMIAMNIYPSGIINHTLLRVEKIDGHDGMYAGAIGLWNSSNVIQRGIIIFDEDWKYPKIIIPTISYSPSLSFDIWGYGFVYTKYKGKHLITLQDGTFITGKRVVLWSNKIEGPYALHSTVYDFSVDTWLTDPGSMLNSSIANMSLYVHNNELYMITSGQMGSTGTDKQGGMSTKHCAYLWKFDDSLKTWSLVVNPIMVGLHGKFGQYDDIPDTTWGNLHAGGCIPQFIENGKMWITGSTKGYGPVFSGSTASYNASLIQIDLTKALK